MISYEDLCQALDRFNRRRNNEAEMVDLNSEEPEAIDLGAEAADDPDDNLLDSADEAISLTDDASEILSDDDDATVAHEYSEEELAPLDGEPTQIADAPPMVALETEVSDNSDFDVADALDVPDDDEREREQ